MAYGYEVSQEIVGCGQLFADECETMAQVFDVLDERGVRWYTPGVVVSELTNEGWQRVQPMALESFSAAFADDGEEVSA